MQYKMIVNGETVDVSFKRTSTGLEADVAGRNYSMEVSAVRPGTYLLHWGSRPIVVSVIRSSDGSKSFSTFIEAHRIPVEILTGRRMLQQSARKSDRGGVSEMRSPMPGKIVRLLMAEGDEVAAGQGIVVMEAMKMQNEIKASLAGRIRKIGVVEGETVGPGHLIAVVEALAGND